MAELMHQKAQEFRAQRGEFDLKGLPSIAFKGTDTAYGWDMNFHAPALAPIWKKAKAAGALLPADVKKIATMEITDADVQNMEEKASLLEFAEYVKWIMNNYHSLDPVRQKWLREIVPWIFTEMDKVNEQEHAEQMKFQRIQRDGIQNEDDLRTFYELLKNAHYREKMTSAIGPVAGQEGEIGADPKFRAGLFNINEMARFIRASKLGNWIYGLPGQPWRQAQAAIATTVGDNIGRPKFPAVAAPFEAPALATRNYTLPRAAGAGGAVLGVVNPDYTGPY
jgi:hypothetical protein